MIYVAVIGSGCAFFYSREVTVAYNDASTHQRDYFRNELINHDGLALESENFLRGNLMQDDFNENPQMILRRLNDYYAISGNPKYLIIAADLCRYLAARAQATKAVQYNLSSLYYCLSYSYYQKNSASPREKNIFDFTSTQSLQAYNEACCGIFSFLKKRNLLDVNTMSLTDIEGHEFVFAEPTFLLSVPREAIEDFSLCASYDVKNMRQFNRQPGMGVPLVAAVKMKQWHSSLKTPEGLTIPVTLLIKPEKGPSGKTVLHLIFVDTGKQESLKISTEGDMQLNYPLALDFSTPLACFLNRLSQRNLLLEMLNPFVQEATDGLYMVEPYQPNKIPVVFIHGLMSSPETWVQMLNSLKNDPHIRSRYQFWFFSYSTGTPVIVSAMKLRNALLDAQKEFCTMPEATANFNQMVLVGHSMGGLLARLMVQKDPHYVFETMFQTPWNQIQAKLQPADFDYLDSFTPYPLPFVHRAVFMAVPHRGADMAKSRIAQFGIRLIKLPASLLSKEDVITRITRTLRPNTFLLSSANRLFTGIDDLNPDTPFAKAVGTSQMKDDLDYHCVIGNMYEEGVPGRSDGVVPYWSSHLDNAASELVVKSSHSVHQKPAAAQELLRILLLHLGNIRNR